MSEEQKLAILRLIPKGEKDTKYIPFLRPISILNTSYKIYAKVLSNRSVKYAFSQGLPTAQSRIDGVII